MLPWMERTRDWAGGGDGRRTTPAGVRLPPYDSALFPPRSSALDRTANFLDTAFMASCVFLPADPRGRVVAVSFGYRFFPSSRRRRLSSVTR
jgi:hypothetical protein